MNKDEVIRQVGILKLSIQDETPEYAFQFIRGFATCQLQVKELLMKIIPDETDPVPVPDADTKADPKPKPAKNDGMPKIDHAKIVTLWKAGWSVKKIAGEFSCAEQTIRNHLQKAKEDGELTEDSRK